MLIPRKAVEPKKTTIKTGTKYFYQIGFKMFWILASIGSESKMRPTERVLYFS